MIPLCDIGLDLARHRRKEVLEPLLHGPAASSYITTVASVIYTTVATAGVAVFVSTLIGAARAIKSATAAGFVLIYKDLNRMALVVLR